MNNYLINKKGIALIAAILIVVGILILAGSGIWYWQNQKEKTTLITVKVLDEEVQSPINEAEVNISYLPPACIGPAVVGFECPPGPKPIEIKKLTNINGAVIFYNEDKKFKKKLLENIKDFSESVNPYSGATKMIYDKISIFAQKKGYLYNFQEIIIKDLLEGKYSNQAVTISLIDMSKAKIDVNYCSKFSDERREKCFEKLALTAEDFNSCYRLPSNFYFKCIQGLIEKNIKIPMIEKIRHCSNIRSEAEKEACVNSIFNFMEIPGFTINICYKIKELKVWDDSVFSGFDKCIKEYVMRKKEKDKCGLIENSIDRKHCFE